MYHYFFNAFPFQRLAVQKCPGLSEANKKRVGEKVDFEFEGVV